MHQNDGFAHGRVGQTGQLGGLERVRWAGA